MQWYSLPVAIMAGISGYAALLFIGFHFVLTNEARRLAHRENLSFAVLCALVMTYDIACAGLYNSHSLETGIQFQRAQLASAALTGAAYLRFTWDFRRGAMSPVARIFFWTLICLGSVVTFWDSPYTLTLSQPSTKHVVIGSFIDLVYYEGEPAAFPSGCRRDASVRRIDAHRRTGSWDRNRTIAPRRDLRKIPPSRRWRDARLRRNRARPRDLEEHRRASWWAHLGGEPGGRGERFLGRAATRRCARLSPWDWPAGSRRCEWSGFTLRIAVDRSPTG